MRKFIKQAFSKKLIFRYYLPALFAAIASIILDRLIPQFNILKILSGFAKLIWKILSQNIPIYAFIGVILIGIIIFKLKNRKLNEEQKFILSIIDEREIGLRHLFIAYKKNFQDKSRVMTRCFKAINKLEKLKLIELGCQTGGINQVQDELFILTDKGKRRLKRVSEKIKDKAEKVFEETYREVHELGPVKHKIKDIKNKEEVVYILGILANQLDKKKLKSTLQKEYFNKFPKKEISDFNYVWSIIEKEKFIFQDRGTTGYGGGYGELPFYITDKGLEFYHSNKDVLK